MSFTPRQFFQILDDSINFVRANTTITDFTVGSVVRTVLEAAAIEDDEQYFQMVQLLDSFSIRSAFGTDLDARVADFNVVRLQPKTSFGRIIIQDGGLKTNSLALDAAVTDVTVNLESSLSFPTSGYPYTIRIGEGTTAVEEVTVTNNNTTSNILSVSALSNNHAIGARVSLVTGSPDINISSGIQVQVPAAGGSPAVVFVTVETGVLANGNYESNAIAAKSVLPGIAANIGPGRISQFTSSPPFSRATVTNTQRFTGGRPVESDAELKDRALLQIQSLASATPLALKNAVLGVTDPVTGQRVSTANVFEKFSQDEVIIYVDDGSGLVPDQVVFARDFLDTTYGTPPTTVLSVGDASEFPDEGYVIISPENSAQTEVVEYTSINYATNDITCAATMNVHDTDDEVALVEVITFDSPGGLDFYSLERWPVVRSSQRIWVGPSPTDLTLMVEDEDYYLNKARGRIEFLTPVETGSTIVASYSYYTGLIFYAQRFVNGSSDDETSFPGTVAAGIEAVVEAPTVRRITVRATITANNGSDEDLLAPLVRTAIEDYIISLGIGKSIVVAEIIERAMNVNGMYNITIQEPSNDITVGAHELPVPFSAAGVSLVTVN